MKKVLLVLSVVFVSVFITGCSTTTQQNNIESGSSYTIDEVSAHNSADDCWMIIDGKVYDVTDYVNTHPGGDKILQGCGKNATKLFDTQGGRGDHSANAENIRDSYYIGDLSE